MNILVIAATSPEIGPLIKYMENVWHKDSGDIFSKSGITVQILITGVGMVATTYQLTKTLHNKRYELVLLLGVAGAFDRNISLGDVVFIANERFGDMGAEDHYNFLDVFELGLEQKDQLPFISGSLQNPIANQPMKIELPIVSAITINSVSGSSFTATSRFKKYQPQVESMEGAPFHYVCLQENIPFAQVRSISNYVEARDKTKWRMDLAITNLNHWAVSFLENITIN